MATDQEDAFHKYLVNSKATVLKDGAHVPLYRGRKDLDDSDIGIDKALLSKVKEAANRGLAGRKRLPEHFDDLPFHFDYIDSEFANAAAFRDGSYAFIGITFPYVREISETAIELSRSARIQEILKVDASVADNLQGILFQHLLFLTITHEFSHHVHGHVIKDINPATFFREFDASGRTGGMERQADEADADGYAAYHVLSNAMHTTARDDAAAALNLTGRSIDSINETLFLSFAVAACAHFSSRGLIDVENVWTETHPIQAARIDYLMRHSRIWCEQFEPALLSVITQETFGTIMRTVADEMWGIMSSVMWRKQAEFLQTDDGRKYMAEMTRLIDDQKARLREITRSIL
jgi:hypothetical protein